MNSAVVNMVGQRKACFKLTKLLRFILSFGVISLDWKCLRAGTVRFQVFKSLGHSIGNRSICRMSNVRVDRWMEEIGDSYSKWKVEGFNFEA